MYIYFFFGRVSLYCVMYVYILLRIIIFPQLGDGESRPAIKFRKSCRIYYSRGSRLDFGLPLNSLWALEIRYLGVPRNVASSALTALRHSPLYGYLGHSCSLV